MTNKSLWLETFSKLFYFIWKTLLLDSNSNISFSETSRTMGKNRPATPWNYLFINRPKPRMMAPAFISALITIHKGKQTQSPSVITISLEQWRRRWRRKIRCSLFYVNPLTPKATRTLPRQLIIPGWSFHKLNYYLPWKRSVHRWLLLNKRQFLQ